MQLVRLSSKDVAEFGTVSGDHNPQYTDEVFARRTPFGGPIVPGALATIAVLAAVDADRLAAAGRIAVRFTRPMFPAVGYRVRVSTTEGGATAVQACHGDLPVLSVELSPGTPFADAGVPGEVELPAEPDTPAPGDIGRGHQVRGDYGLVSPAGLRALADRLGATAVPDALLGALAWGSWFAGMRLPGRDALFSGMRVSAVSAMAAEPEHAGGYVATVKSADARTGTVLVRAESPGLEFELRAFQRSPVPAPDWSSATRLLPRGEGLAGSTVLVVGGSRGIGSAIVSVLVAQGATVLATQRAPGAVEALQREFGADRVRPLLLDATDDGSVRSAFARLADEGTRLSGVVLCAGPPVLFSTVHPDAVDGIREFVDTSLTSALLPLSCALDLLAPGAWLAVLSSGAVEDVPEQRPQYFIAKSAVEALATYCAHQHDLLVLLARAPKMWTDMSNGPLVRMGAVPTEQVASAIVHWVLWPPAEPGVTIRSSAELTSWAAPDPAS